MLIYEIPTKNRNTALFRILIRTVFNLACSLFLMAEFVIKASPTPAKTTKVAAALPSKIPANALTQDWPLSPKTTLKLTSIIPITANARATSIPIILCFIPFFCWLQFNFMMLYY